MFLSNCPECYRLLLDPPISPDISALVLNRNKIPVTFSQNFRNFITVILKISEPSLPSLPLSFDSVFRRVNLLLAPDSFLPPPVARRLRKGSAAL